MQTLRLVVLGSGTCVPSPTRNAPGYLVEAGRTNLLLDCGSGVVRQLVRAGRSHMTLDAVLVSHMHPDHVSDLPALLHALKYTPGTTRKKTLHIISAPDLEAYFERAVYALLSRPETFSVEFISEMDSCLPGDCHVAALPTRHSRDSLAFRVTTAAGSVVFTGDSDYEPDLVAFCHGADLLVADCSFPDQMKMIGHMVPSECGRLAGEAEVKHLILSHLYPTAVPDRERITQASREYSGPISLAADLAEYVVGEDGVRKDPISPLEGEEA